MDEREDHIVKAYEVIQHTINSKGGPCSKLTYFIEGKLRIEREDLIQMVATDYVQYYKNDYDETKSALNTYVNKFIRWRLMSYIRETTWSNRAISRHTTSWDKLGEDYGDEVRHSFIKRGTNDDYYWNLFAKALEASKKNK